MGCRARCRVELRRRVHDITDEAQRLGGPSEAQQLFRAASALGVFKQSLIVASRVCIPFAQLRRDLDDPELLERFAERERLQVAQAAHLRLRREERELAARRKQKIDEHLRDMYDSLRRVEAIVARWEAELGASAHLSDLPPPSPTPGHAGDLTPDDDHQSRRPVNGDLSTADTSDELRQTS